MRVWATLRAPEPGARPMDLVYLTLGLAALAVFGVYAAALRRI